MQSGYQEFQTYLRQTFPEFSELTAYEIYQIKKQDLNFINTAAKYLNNSSDLLCSMFFFDYYEYIKSNSTDLFDFMDEFFPMGLFFSENNKRIIPITYNGHFSQTKINKYTTYFSIDYQGDEYTQIFYGEQILKYNKHNLSKIYLNAIKNVKYNILQDDIVFNYLLIFLSKHTDLYGFFERSYIEHLNKLIFTEMTPPSDLKKDKLSFLVLEKIDSYLYVKNNNHNNILKIDLATISENNFFLDLIEPLKKYFILFDELQKEFYTNKWFNYIINEIPFILGQPSLDINFLSVNINNKNCYSSFLDKNMYSGVVIANINCKQLNKGIVVSTMLSNIMGEHDLIIDLHEQYKIFKDHEQLNCIFNNSNTIKTKKRI